ncbi:MAG: alpha/beta hydrolase fold domain-containing protein [Planctomycetia bacterium]|nr:alpha/beta hydrolase fold domain-containing protein [Planctomycetia bacterium]
MKQIISLVLALAVALGSSTSAQDNDRQNERRQPFQQFFTLPGIEFSTEQLEKVEELRKEFVPKLTENQNQWNGVVTDEQQQARRRAFQEARDAGKEGQQLRDAVDAAIKFTEDQKEQRAAIQKERNKLLEQIRTQLVSSLTDEQKAQQRRQGSRNTGVRAAVAPTHRDLKYGPYERNVMDVWLAKSDKPTPVLVSIHGGGFRGGNKSVSGDILTACLDLGISVVAITYRLSDEAIAPAQFLDSARATQFIRHNAKDWNLDPTRIAATGGSAGAGISLWLGFHDDLADPDNKDPVLRQSTRLACMAVYNGQTSYDPRFIRDLFPGTDTYKHPALPQLFGVEFDQLDDLPEEKLRLLEEVSALPHLTKDDVPAALFYASKLDTSITSQGIGIHHPRFGKALKEKMDELGIECEVHTGIPRGDEWTKLTMDFMKKHLGVE